MKTNKTDGARPPHRPKLQKKTDLNIQQPTALTNPHVLSGGRPRQVTSKATPVVVRAEQPPLNPSAPKFYPMSIKKRAATVIQKFFRGYLQRLKNAKVCQKHFTPYPSEIAYHMATCNYSPIAMKLRPIGSTKRKTEWGVYQSTENISPGTPAFLHRLERPQDFLVAWEKHGSPTWRGKGNVYQPELFGSKTHDYRTNTAWLLGLGHQQVPVVVTTTVDDRSVIRRSAWSRFCKPSTEYDLSAFARELIGMVQNGQYEAEIDATGSLILKPTDRAKTATLSSYETPKGMPEKEIVLLLEQNGIRTQITIP